MLQVRKDTAQRRGREHLPRVRTLVAEAVEELVLSSPAKINLFLELIGRRPDGYHEIESVMQLVDLCDRVHLRRRAGGIRVTVAGGECPPGPANLAYQAAVLFMESAGLRDGVHVHLEKRIPVAGGLGGGSSNAAAVLVGLSRLFDIGSCRETLRLLAARLGSDVPFFLSEGLAVATGRGEILTALNPWPPHWLVVANAGVPISTAWAYEQASSKLTDGGPRASIRTFITDGRLAWPPVWAFNRFEAVMLPLREEVRALKSLLREGGGFPVLMSGSGGSVFAVVQDAAAAQALTARAEASGAFAAAIRTLPFNPMLAEGTERCR